MTDKPDISALLSAGETRDEGVIRDQIFAPLVDWVSEMPGGAARSELTIASGSITPTAAAHTVDTEGDTAADDLTHIATTHHPAGRILILSAADQARVPTVKHAAGGAGQVLLADGADWTLSAGRVLALLRILDAWHEIGRWWGGDAAGLLAWLSAVPTSRTLTAGTGLTGGGDLSANRTIALDATSNAALALAATALQPGDVGSAAVLNAAAGAGDLLRTDTLGTVSQAEAEEGVATTQRLWTAERVAQAIAARAAGGETLGNRYFAGQRSSSQTINSQTYTRVTHTSETDPGGILSSGVATLPAGVWLVLAHANIGSSQAGFWYNMIYKDGNIFQYGMGRHNLANTADSVTTVAVVISNGSTTVEHRVWCNTSGNTLYAYSHLVGVWLGA